MMFRRLVTVITIVAVWVGVVPALAYPGAPGFLPGIEYAENFPDPHVIEVDGYYFAYGTNTGGPKLPMLWSVDLERWYTHDRWDAAVPDSSPFGNDALVEVPEWAAPFAGGAEVWAPAVVRLATGWRAYYAMRATNGSRPKYCVSVAHGAGPQGPFYDRSQTPLTCGYGPAGAIDPWVHVDGNRAWLLWKNEAYPATTIADDDVHFPRPEAPPADPRIPPPPPRRLPASGNAIWAQELNADGSWFAPDSRASVLLTASRSNWEVGIIENPAMFSMNGALHLLYSGNRFGSSAYATGWARCDTPVGPCHRASGAPILSTDATQNGPGGASVFVDLQGEHQVAYHAWNPPYASYPPYPSCDTDGDRVCKDQGQRFMHIEVLCNLPGGALTVGVPTRWVFCDTDATSWKGPGVEWLSGTGITTGVSPHYFAPDRSITRAEMVTMLWRWAGSPGGNPASPFGDLRAGAFYVEAVEWAAANGIVEGTAPTTFAPDVAITRGQVATIFHRAAGLPDPVNPSGFTDVPEGTYFTTAVAWLAETGITTGFSPTRFGPEEPATRAQFATMLCRASTIEFSTVQGVVDRCLA